MNYLLRNSGAFSSLRRVIISQTRTFAPISRLASTQTVKTTLESAPGVQSASGDSDAILNRNSGPSDENIASNEESPVATSSTPERSAQRRPRHPNYKIPRGIKIGPDNDPLLTYFASHLMRDGHRHKAIRVVANTLNTIHSLTRSAPLPIFQSAIERASPDVKVVSEKRRNKNVMTPHPLGAKQRTGQAIRWIIKASESRKNVKLEQRLAREIIAIIDGSSEVWKLQEQQHLLAMSNRFVIIILSFVFVSLMFVVATGRMPQYGYDRRLYTVAPGIYDIFVVQLGI